MPQFPRYQSKAQLTTQQPSVQAAEDTSGEVIQKVGEVGKTIQDISLKWSNAVDTIQKTTSTANRKASFLDITTRATNDPNHNNAEQYYKEIDKSIVDNQKGFSSKTAETENLIEANYDAQVAKIQIQNLYKKKMIDVGQTSSLKIIDAEVNNPTENSLANIRRELNIQVQTGIFDHKDAYQLERKANDDLGVNRINKDLYLAQTPEQVDTVTQGITSGAYEKGGVTIEPDKKKALLDIADRSRTNVEKKIEAQQVEALAQNRVDVISGVASGQIDLQTLNIAEIAEFDPKLGATLTKAKEFMKDYNPKIPKEQQRVSMAGVLSQSELMKARSYAKSVNDVFMQNDNEKLGEFILRELEKKGDGTTSSVKLAAFMQLAALKFKANNPKSPEDFEAVKRLNAIKAGFNFLKTSNPYLAGFSILDLIIRNAFSGASTKEEVMREARSVLEDKVIERYASVSKLPSVPNKIVDGEASVEDLHSGLNDLEGENFIGDYDNQSGE